MRTVHVGDAGHSGCLIFFHSLLLETDSIWKASIEDECHGNGSDRGPSHTRLVSDQAPRPSQESSHSRRPRCPPATFDLVWL